MEVGELLPRLSILTARKADGGLFLLPFSGGLPRLTLSATLPCDARTFLTVLPFGMIPRGRPTKLPHYYITSLRESQELPEIFNVMLISNQALQGSVPPAAKGPFEKGPLESPKRLINSKFLFLPTV